MDTIGTLSVTCISGAYLAQAYRIMLALPSYTA